MTSCLIFINIQNKSFWQEVYYKLLALILSLSGHASYTVLPKTTLMLHARQMVLNGQVTPMSTVRFFFFEFSVVHVERRLRHFFTTYLIPFVLFSVGFHFFFPFWHSYIENNLESFNWILSLLIGITSTGIQFYNS